MSKNCTSWPDHVEAYIHLYKKDNKNLKFLAKHIQEKEKSDNFDFIYEQVKDLYDVRIRKIMPDLIGDLKEIDNMSGKEFEEYLEKCLIISVMML